MILLNQIKGYIYLGIGILITFLLGTLKVLALQKESLKKDILNQQKEIDELANAVDSFKAVNILRDKANELELKNTTATRDDIDMRLHKYYRD